MKSTEHNRTRHFNILLVILAVAGLIAVLIAIDPMARAAQGLRSGWPGHRGLRDADMSLCNTDHAEQFGGMGDYVKTWLDLDTAQVASWERVEQELGRGVAALQDICREYSGTDRLAPMPERLARMEAVMAATTAALHAVRPAFTEFYGTLDEGQRREIDGLPGR